jgi:hypothetical protein
MSSSESSSPDATSPRPCTDTALAVLVKGLPEMLLRQFEYEDPIVRGGKHLLHSAFFKELVSCLVVKAQDFFLFTSKNLRNLFVIKFSLCYFRLL